MSQYISFSSYSPAADIVVMAMVVLLLVAAGTDISFYSVAKLREFQVVANWIRCCTTPRCCCP